MQEVQLFKNHSTLPSEFQPNRSLHPYLVFVVRAHGSRFLLLLHGAWGGVGRGVAIGGMGGTRHLPFLRYQHPFRWPWGVRDWTRTRGNQIFDQHQTNVTTALLTSGQMLLERIYFISFNNRTVLNLADCRHSSLLACSFSIQGQQRLKRCTQTTRRHICWLLTQALKTRFQEQCYLFTRVATLTLELSYNL